MDTKALVQRVRELTHEYNDDPISDEYIINRLQEAYRFVHNHYCKANPEMYGKLIPFSISTGIMEYDMPEKLWNKRCDWLAIPTPPNESVTPWGYTKIERRQYAQTFPYQTNRIRTYYPETWSILNNKIYIFPAPLISYTAQLIVNRKIPMLGVYGGQIIGLRENVIYLDELNDSRILGNVGYNHSAFISICDWDTGEVKALYSYSAVNTTTKTITLQTSPFKYASNVIQDITYVAVTAGATVGEQINIRYINGGALSVSVSNYTIVVTLNTGVSNATNVAAAIAGTPAAAALVTPTVTGTGATVQVAYTNPIYLIGGENQYQGETISELPGSQWGTVQKNDIVTYGLSTGVSIFGEALDTFLTDWAVQRLRGPLNESDPETINSLKLQIQDLSGDNVGRNLGMKISMVERNFYGQRTFRRGR